MKKLKILVINTKFLGDLIVSTPGLRSLRHTYPNAEIIFLLRKGFEDVLENNPNIDRIISFDARLKGNSNLKKVITGIKFVKELRKEKFDIVIALHPGDRIAFWAWFSKAKKRIAPKKQSFNFLFNVLVDVKEDSISYLEYYTKIFEAAGVKIDFNRTEFFIEKTDEQWADEFINQHTIENESIIIGIHPGASEPTKMWKKEYFVQLINSLIPLRNYFIIVFEGPQDEEIIGYLKNEICSKNLIFIKNSIPKVAALIKKCRLFLTHDTGTRHLSVAVETPTITLIPEDNKKYWNFYSEDQKHHSIIGIRNQSLDSSIGKPFLDGITVEFVHNKIIQLMQQ